MVENEEVISINRRRWLKNGMCQHTSSRKGGPFQGHPNYNNLHACDSVIKYKSYVRKKFVRE